MIRYESFEKSTIPSNTVFLDIETSGLSPHKDDISIIGLAKYFNYKKYRIITLISENNEKELIYEFLNSIIGNYEIYTFNGYEFEEKFLNQKIIKYDISFNFKQFKFISIKSILKNYSNFISLESFTRKDVENYFQIHRNYDYDMKKIVKTLKKDNLLYNQELINHNIDEIQSLVKLFNKINNFQFDKKIFIKDKYFYLNNFSIFSESLKLSFKTDRHYKFGQFYLSNGEKMIIFQNRIDIELFIKIIYNKDEKIIVFENKDEYIPLFIKNDIIYENIYFILKLCLKHQNIIEI